MSFKEKEITKNNIIKSSNTLVPVYKFPVLFLAYIVYWLLDLVIPD